MGIPDYSSSRSRDSCFRDKAITIFHPSIAVQRAAIDTVPADASNRAKQQRADKLQGAAGEQPCTIYLRACKRLCCHGYQFGIGRHQQLHWRVQPVYSAAGRPDALPGNHTRNHCALCWILGKPSVCYKIRGLQHKQLRILHQPCLLIYRLLNAESLVHITGPLQPYAGIERQHHNSDKRAKIPLRNVDTPIRRQVHRICRGPVRLPVLIMADHERRYGRAFNIAEHNDNAVRKLHA